MHRHTDTTARPHSVATFGVITSAILALHAGELELAINLVRALGGGYQSPPGRANMNLK
jgi:hypothetical protein